MGRKEFLPIYNHFVVVQRPIQYKVIEYEKNQQEPPFYWLKLRRVASLARPNQTSLTIQTSHI